MAQGINQGMVGAFIRFGNKNINMAFIEDFTIDEHRQIVHIIYNSGREETITDKNIVDFFIAQSSVIPNFIYKENYMPIINSMKARVKSDFMQFSKEEFSNADTFNALEQKKMSIKQASETQSRIKTDFPDHQ